MVNLIGAVMGNSIGGSHNKLNKRGEDINLIRMCWLQSRKNEDFQSPDWPYLQMPNPANLPIFLCVLLNNTSTSLDSIETQIPFSSSGCVCFMEAAMFFHRTHHLTTKFWRESIWLDYTYLDVQDIKHQFSHEIQTHINLIGRRGVVVYNDFIVHP